MTARDLEEKAIVGLVNDWLCKYDIFVPRELGARSRCGRSRPLTRSPSRWGGGGES